MAPIVRYSFKRLIGSTWVGHDAQALPDEPYEACLERQRAKFGADRIEPIVEAQPKAETVALMVNSRTLCKLAIDLTEVGDQPDDELKGVLLALPPIAGALGDRTVKRWLVGPTWLNILTEDSA